MSINAEAYIKVAKLIAKAGITLVESLESLREQTMIATGGMVTRFGDKVRNLQAKILKAGRIKKDKGKRVCYQTELELERMIEGQNIRKFQFIQIRKIYKPIIGLRIRRSVKDKRRIKQGRNYHDNNNENNS